MGNVLKCLKIHVKLYKYASDADKYGHVDQAAAWMLLARLYLNAEVYTGTARWADAVC